jgi:hypothetical protein
MDSVVEKLQAAGYAVSSESMPAATFSTKFTDGLAPRWTMQVRGQTVSYCTGGMTYDQAKEWLDKTVAYEKTLPATWKP